MNSEKYKELKEMVISMNRTELINLFEIVIDEINHKNIEISIETLSQDED